MPTYALYWYGNECTWITGGYQAFKNNTINATPIGWANGFISTNSISITNISAVHVIIKGTHDYGAVNIGSANWAKQSASYTKQSASVSSLSGKVALFTWESNTSDSNRINTKNTNSMYVETRYGNPTRMREMTALWAD